MITLFQKTKSEQERVESRGSMQKESSQGELGAVLAEGALGRENSMRWYRKPEIARHCWTAEREMGVCETGQEREATGQATKDIEPSQTN